MVVNPDRACDEGGIVSTAGQPAIRRESKARCSAP
jgi:hypothetical protein